MSYVIPVLMIVIILYALKSKISVYSIFCEGVEQGLKTVIGIFPVILAITVSFSMLRVSGLLNIIINFISPVTDIFKIPTELLPLAIVRPLSGGGALGIFTELLKTHGANTFITFCAALIMGSSETTFYTLGVYYKNTRVKYNSYIIPAALFGDIVGVITGVALTTIFF